MYARCPSCNTTFAITAKQLEVRDGLVRCGRCFDVFNARWNLLDKKADAGESRPVATPVRKDGSHPQPFRNSERATAITEKTRQSYYLGNG